MLSTPALYDRFLTRLGVSARKPSVSALTELYTAFTSTIPFENISKLYYRKHDRENPYPSLERYVSGLESRGFGGTCYTNNFYLNGLLRYLGYDADFCGCDMNDPDVHTANLVRLDGREFIVDVGYGAPFFTPMPRDLAEPLEMAIGQDTYVLRPRDENGYSRMDHFRDDGLIHGYIMKPGHREIDFFRETIDDSYSSESTFMRTVTVITYQPGRMTAIREKTLIEVCNSDVSKTVLPDWETVAEQIVASFGMPREAVRDALEELQTILNEAERET